jgi:LPS-assembly lipoprotein
LRLNLQANKVKLVTSAEQADVVLNIVSEIADKQILTLGGSGRVNEFQLRYRVSFRAYDSKQRVWMPADELVMLRDYSYDDTKILAKEAEEAMITQSMRGDMVQQIVRRLSRAKPQPLPALP